MEKPRVLLVDDDIDLNDALKSSLKGLEYEVETAFDSTEALKLFSQMPFDLIITDNDMKWENEGLSLVRIIRETSKIPILMMTGGTISAADAKAAGVNAFHTKPFNLEDLELFILSALVGSMAK